MIVEIIFSDYYRTFLLCILSMGVTFFIRKFSVKEGVLALVMYEFIMLIPFVWILIVSVVFTEFNFQQIIEICSVGAKMDNLFYNVYGVAIHNVLSFLEKKCNIQNRNFTLLCHCCCCSFVCD